MNIAKAKYTRALIYCRVSSQQQVTTGNGLDSQEYRCIQKAKELDLEVAAIFPDGAISGGLFERPSMNKLMAFLDNNKDEKFVVIFDDLKRFARDVEVHLRLKSELVKKREVKLECLNFKFDESPTGRFVEVVMAGAAQLEREQNREQVMNKMKARLESGFWPFCPPPGLKQVGRVLQNIEPYANILKSAIEGYANYYFTSQEEVRKFILHEYKKNGITTPLSLNGTQCILREILYCGYVEYEPWGVERQKAKHDGFISYETYLRVQKRMQESSKPRAHVDYGPDFPLRNFVKCRECGGFYTAAWFQGKEKKYPYYKCRRCNILITRSQIEDDFTDLLLSISPHPEVMKGLPAVLSDIYKSRKDLNTGDTYNLDEMVKDITEFLSDPVKHWESPHIQEKKLLLSMYFPDPLVYGKKSLWLNTKISDIFEVIGNPRVLNPALVETGNILLNKVWEYLCYYSPRIKPYIQKTPS